MVGSAGTGKSHVIKLVSQWSEYFLRTEGVSLDEPNVILCAFTGSAAANIGIIGFSENINQMESVYMTKW